MLQKKSTKILLFLVLPVVIAGISFAYNFAGYLFSAGPLTLGHKEFDNSCFKCHMPFVSVSTSCLSCHKPVQESIDKTTGFHGHMEKKIVEKCLTCHIDHKGSGKFIVRDGRTHEDAQKNLAEIIKEHPQTYRGILSDPDKKHFDLWPNLEASSNWPDRLKAIQDNFDHRFTGYPLTGKHNKIKCEECHKSIKNFQPIPKEGHMPSFSMEKEITKDFCLSCHKKDDDSQKGHKGKYGKDCSSCHILGDSRSGWKLLTPKIRNFHEKPENQLKGKHAKTDCRKCHETAPFKKKDEEKTCVFCHIEADKKIHKESLGKKCESCHNPESFRKSSFDHQKTKFPLRDAHKKTGCQKCHPEWIETKEKSKVYRKIENPSCFTCHARDDVHRGSFKNDCAACHRETYWGDTIQR